MARYVCMLLTIGLAGCAEDQRPPRPETEVAVPLESGPRVMLRLSRSQYANAVHDVLGDDIVAPSALEPDVAVHGFAAIGAGETSVSRRGVDQYEAAAYAIASQVFAPERRARFVPCTPAGAADLDCARQVLGPLARRAWRRPVLAEELEALAAVATEAAMTLGDFHDGLEYGLAAILQSPDFVYRPQIGQPSAVDPEHAQLDAFELAARLSFFLWNTTPDEALLAAAESGALDDAAGLDAEIDRLLASPRSRDGLRAFVSQWLQLDGLLDLSKDTAVFVVAGPDLGPSAREAILRTVEHHVFDLQADYRELFTSRLTFVDPRLAALYRVQAPSLDGFAPLELPEDSPRRGLLGQAGILALHAHPIASSPTLRGKFVREVLLCQVVAPPPVNVNTAIPEPSPDARTLRERLARHREEQACAVCHDQLDPVGLALENFDAVGQFRVMDSGAMIDPSGELDGVEYDGPVGLGEALAEHPDAVPCFIDSMTRYATGRLASEGETGAQYELGAIFAQSGYRVRDLMRAMARHPMFRRVAMEEGAAL